MKKLILLLSLVLLASLFVFKTPAKVEIAEDLKLKIQDKVYLWSQKYAVSSPKVVLRLNKTNEGFYDSQDKVITILVNKDSADLGNIESITAHEFGHHYLMEKEISIDNQQMETVADLIAYDLVGESFIKTLESNHRLEDGVHSSLSNRVAFLKLFKTKP